MEPLSSNIKKIQEAETPKKIPYISGKGKGKKASYISGNETSQSTSRKFLIFQDAETPKKIFIFQETKTPKKSLYFPKRDFFISEETELSDISGKVYSEPWHN